MLLFFGSNELPDIIVPGCIHLSAFDLSDNLPTDFRDNENVS